MSSLHPQLQPYEPTKADPFDSVKAAHLLNRAGFGGTVAEVKKAVELGPRGAVGWLMDFADKPAGEQDAADLPNLSAINEYPVNPREMAQQMFAGKTDEERRQTFMKMQMANRAAEVSTAGWWLNRMAWGKHRCRKSSPSSGTVTSPPACAMSVRRG